MLSCEGQFYVYLKSHLLLSQVHKLCSLPDLRGVRFGCRLPKSHAGPHRPQVCQQSGGHQVLRSRYVSQTRVLKAQMSFIETFFLFIGTFAPVHFFSGCCQRVLRDETWKRLVLLHTPHLLHHEMVLQSVFLQHCLSNPSFGLIPAH